MRHYLIAVEYENENVPDDQEKLIKDELDDHTSQLRLAIMNQARHVSVSLNEVTEQQMEKAFTADADIPGDQELE